jgi:hypothetical protein
VDDLIRTDVTVAGRRLEVLAAGPNASRQAEMPRTATAAGR